MKFKQIKSKIFKNFQKLQPKILVFTFGASLLPVLFVFTAAWEFVYQPLIELEKTRLEDQVLAFKGYTAATSQGLADLASGYAIWTDLYNAIEKNDRTWIEDEVTNQLIFSTSVDNTQVITRQGKILAQNGKNWQFPEVQKQTAESIAKGKANSDLVEFADRYLLILVTVPVVKTDGSGNSPGTLVVGQTLNGAWLQKFLNYSQPTTKLEIIALTSQIMFSSTPQTTLDRWEKNNFDTNILPTIRRGHKIYRIEPNSGYNTIYAPIDSKGKSIAIAKIQISSQYFQQATFVLNRLVWIGLAIAIGVSIAIAHFLAKQIGKPIEQLAKRSKHLADGDLDTAIPGINSGGEIGQLANAYQEMALALKALINNLEQRVIERTQELELARQTLEERVERRTQEISQKNDELQQAHDKLQELNSELSIKAEQLSETLANLKRTQAQLIQTEKMSSLGQLVAGIAHEINNPINFIYANLTYVSDYAQKLVNAIELYQQRYSDREIAEYLETIEFDFIITDLPKILSSMQLGADRISKIVISLRNFSRLDESEKKLVNIHEGIESTLLILQNRLYSHTSDRDRIEVIKEYGNLPLVECYPRQINQVFINIISNSIDELQALNNHPHKRIIIKTEIDARKNCVWIKIKDNGAGIQPQIKTRIFDPFFTTKPVGKGTGLGLSISYQIIEKHGGNIEVISEPGQGAEFVISLPSRVKSDRQKT